MVNSVIPILSLVLISESFAIRVKVSYKNTKDELRFATTDKSICSKYNARYLETVYNEVLCECNYKHSFFGIDGESPRCRDERSGQIYGKRIYIIDCSFINLFYAR